VCYTIICSSIKHLRCQHEQTQIQKQYQQQAHQFPQPPQLQPPQQYQNQLQKSQQYHHNQQMQQKPTINLSSHNLLRYNRNIYLDKPHHNDKLLNRNRNYKTLMIRSNNNNKSNILTKDKSSNPSYR